MILMGFAMSAQAVSVNEFNHRGGETHDPYPYVGVPLLSGFALAYGSQEECGFLGLSCSLNAVDKRMRTMEIMPGAECQGGLRVTFMDHSADDGYYYGVRHHSFGSPNRRTHTVEGWCPAFHESPSTCRFPIDVPPLADSGIGGSVFVLVGFRFFNSYAHADRKVSKIGVMRRGDEIVVDFGDGQRDERPGAGYLVTVSYAWVPRRALDLVDASSGIVTDGSGIVVPSGLPESNVVLRGFRLEFTGDQRRNINRVIVLAPELIPGLGLAKNTMSLADKSMDEDFAWEIEWATLREPILAPDAIFRDPSP
jgi:hypothetical protein